MFVAVVNGSEWGAVGLRLTNEPHGLRKNFGDACRSMDKTNKRTSAASSCAVSLAGTTSRN